MTTENEGLYTSTDNATDPNVTEAGKDGANNPNQSMDTLPLGEGVHTVEEAEHHEEGARWNDGKCRTTKIRTTAPTTAASRSANRSPTFRPGRAITAGALLLAT